jgi:hypothetical protein
MAAASLGGMGRNERATNKIGTWRASRLIFRRKCVWTLVRASSMPSDKTLLVLTIQVRSRQVKRMERLILQCAAPCQLLTPPA